MVFRFLIITAILLPLLLPPSALAQSSPSFLDRLRSVFSRPSLGPASGRRRGAAIRSGSCQSQQGPLTALIPLYPLETGKPVALTATTADYPTLWFYLPYDLTPDRPAELRLETPDPTNAAFTQQRTLLRLTQAPAGVIGVRFPSTEPPLAVDQRYHWLFVVACDRRDVSTHQFVEGSIVRLAASPEVTLWNDAITTLVTQRRTTPQDPQLRTQWTELLNAADLDAIATAPITPCCEANP